MPLVVGYRGVRNSWLEAFERLSDTEFLTFVLSCVEWWQYTRIANRLTSATFVADPNYHEPLPQCFLTYGSIRLRRSIAMDVRSSSEIAASMIDATVSMVLDSVHDQIHHSSTSICLVYLEYDSSSIDPIHVLKLPPGVVSHLSNRRSCFRLSEYSFTPFCWAFIGNGLLCRHFSGRDVQRTNVA